MLQKHAVYQDREHYAFIVATLVRTADGQTQRVYVSPLLSHVYCLVKVRSYMKIIV